MSTRAAGRGLLALLGGVVVLIATDAVLATTLGVVAIVAGAVTLVVAGLRGVGGDGTPEGALRAAAAEQHSEAASSANLQRAAETGRWPRIIGGG